MKGQEKFMRKKAAEIMGDNRAEISGGAGALIGISLVILIVALVFTIAPLLGSEVESAVDIPAGSPWNATENSDITTGVEVWEKAKLIIAALVIVIMSIVIAYLIAMTRGAR